MGVLEDVVEFVRGTTGVIDIMVMDDDTSMSVMDIEHSVKTRTDHDYQNVGYDIAMKKTYRICVFFSQGYLFEKRSVLKLMTSDGTIMGTNLRPEEIPEYRKRTDVIWISDDFVVFPNIVGKGEESFVLYPAEVPEISESAPGCIGPIIVSPTTSSDALLKKVSGIPLAGNVFTSIIAFDE